MCNMHWLELQSWRKINSKIPEGLGITSKNRDKFKKSFCTKNNYKEENMNFREKDDLNNKYKEKEIYKEESLKQEKEL